MINFSELRRTVQAVLDSCKSETAKVHSSQFSSDTLARLQSPWFPCIFLVAVSPDKLSVPHQNHNLKQR